MNVPPRSSSSQMDVEESCPTKFLWRYVYGYNMRLTGISMIQGTIIGAAIERGLMEGWDADQACEFAETLWTAQDLSSVGWQDKDKVDRQICVTQNCPVAEYQSAAIVAPDTVAGIIDLINRFADKMAPEKVVDEETGKERKPLKAEYDKILQFRVPGVYGWETVPDPLACPGCGGTGNIKPMAWESRRVTIVACIRAFFLSSARKRIKKVHAVQAKYELPAETGARPFVNYPDIIADVAMQSGEEVTTVLDIKTAAQAYIAGIEHFDSQLSFEAYAYKEVNGIKGPVQVGFIVITTGTAPTVDMRLSTRNDDDSVRSLEARIVSDKRLEIYQQVGFPMLGKNYKCGMCDFNILCRFKRGESWLEKEIGNVYTQREKRS